MGNSSYSTTERSREQEYEQEAHGIDPRRIRQPFHLPIGQDRQQRVVLGEHDRDDERDRKDPPAGGQRDHVLEDVSDALVTGAQDDRYGKKWAPRFSRPSAGGW